MSFGWGTNLTNDFAAARRSPTTGSTRSRWSARSSDANGRPAVKLSDNPEKATGGRAEIERYLRVFGAEGQLKRPVLV